MTEPLSVCKSCVCLLPPLVAVCNIASWGGKKILLASSPRGSEKRCASKLGLSVHADSRHGEIKH